MTNFNYSLQLVIQAFICLIPYNLLQSEAPSRPAHESFSAANLASSAANSENKVQHPLHLNNNKPDSPNLAKVSESAPLPTLRYTLLRVIVLADFFRFCLTTKLFNKKQ